MLRGKKNTNESVFGILWTKHSDFFVLDFLLVMIMLTNPSWIKNTRLFLVCYQQSVQIVLLRSSGYSSWRTSPPTAHKMDAEIDSILKFYKKIEWHKFLCIPRNESFSILVVRMSCTLLVENWYWRVWPVLCFDSFFSILLSSSKS